MADLTEEVVYTSEMALKWITKGESKILYCIFPKTLVKTIQLNVFRLQITFFVLKKKLIFFFEF